MEYLTAFAICLAIVAFDKLFIVLGPIPYAISSFLTRARYLGWIFSFLMNNPINAKVAMKFSGWIISGIGCFFGLYIIEELIYINSIQYLIISFVGIIIILDSSGKFIFFEFSKIELIDNVKTFIGKIGNYDIKILNEMFSDRQVRKMLIVQNYLDMSISSFFRIIFANSLFIYCGVRSEIFHFEKNTDEQRVESILSSISMIGIGQFENGIIYNSYYEYLSIFIKITFIFCLTFFATIGIDLIREDYIEKSDGLESPDHESIEDRKFNVWKKIKLKRKN